MRLLITGGTGVLGRALRSPAQAAGHEFAMPGRALLEALSLPSGIYNVCRDGECVSNERFTRATGWQPKQ